MPFIIGNEAQPRVLSWETNPDFDRVVGEHFGYQRLAQPVTHRRTIEFNKAGRWWRVQDELTGEGVHELKFRFHLRPDLEADARPDGTVAVCDKMTGARLRITSNAGASPLPDLEVSEGAAAGTGKLADMSLILEPRFSSNDYGHREPSVSVCWSVHAALPFSASFWLLPILAGEDENERLAQTQVGNN